MKYIKGFINESWSDKKDTLEVIIDICESFYDSYDFDIHFYKPEISKPAIYTRYVNTTLEGMSHFGDVSDDFNELTHQYQFDASDKKYLGFHMTITSKINVEHIEISNLPIIIQQIKSIKTLCERLSPHAEIFLNKDINFKRDRWAIGILLNK